MTAPDALGALGVDECFELLRGVEIGRVAVAPGSTAPHVVPVTYVVVDDTIVFRTGVGTKLDALRDHPVSFQVDVIDPFHRTGWCVLVQGVAEEIEADADLPLRPWLPGELDHWIRIVPVTVSGRRLHLPPIVPHPGDRGYV